MNALPLLPLQGARWRTAAAPLAVVLSACAATPTVAIESNLDMGRQGVPAWAAVQLAELMGGDLAKFGDVLERGDEYRLKVELAVPVADGEGFRVVRSSLDFGPDYFYPASSVKTCAVLAAVEQLARGRLASGEDLGLETPMAFQPLFEGESLEVHDPSQVNGGTITVGHDLRKVFLVSDNAAYNRLYELSGPQLIGEVMAQAGFQDTRIVHRLSEFRSRTDQLRLPAIEFRAGKGVLWSLSPRQDDVNLDNSDLTGISFGTGHMQGNEVVDGPMSFLHKNWMPLRELIDMNIAILAPEVTLDGRRGFQLEEAHRGAIMLAMAQCPEESMDPAYDRARYPYEYSKFLAPGVLRVRAKDEVTIRDKVGRAYGFSVTNSDVIDHVTGRRFFLAATVYINPNGVVGDGVYGYDRADRFLADLGEVVARAVFGPGRAEGESVPNPSSAAKAP